MNAHVNFDLALTLDRVGVGPDRRQRYRDHHAVTEVIRAILDDAQDAMAARDAPGLATLDASLGRVDEALWVFTVDECRDSAWRTACALASRFRARRRFARWVNDVTATGAAHALRSSRASGRLHGLLRRLEGSADR